MRSANFLKCPRNRSRKTHNVKVVPAQREGTKSQTGHRGNREGEEGGPVDAMTVVATGVRQGAAEVTANGFLGVLGNLLNF